MLNYVFSFLWLAKFEIRRMQSCAFDSHKPFCCILFWSKMSKIATCTTSMGTFQVELFCETMPITCCKSQYVNLTYHTIMCKLTSVNVSWSGCQCWYNYNHNDFNLKCMCFHRQLHWSGKQWFLQRSSLPPCDSWFHEPVRLPQLQRPQLFQSWNWRTCSWVHLWGSRQRHDHSQFQRIHPWRVQRGWLPQIQ